MRGSDRGFVYREPAIFRLSVSDLTDAVCRLRRQKLPRLFSMKSTNVAGAGATIGWWSLPLVHPDLQRLTCGFGWPQ